MSLLGGNIVSKVRSHGCLWGCGKGLPALLCCQVFQSNLYLLDLEKSKPAPQKHCACALLMSEELLQLCTGLREEIIQCKVSP